MAERDDCINDILKSIRDRRDRKFVSDRIEELDARANADDSRGTYGERLARAAEEMLREEQIRSTIRRRNYYNDTLKFRDLRSFIEAANEQQGSFRLGIEASLVGVNTPIFDPRARKGNQDSAASFGLGAQKDWIGGAILDMARAGAENPALRGLDKLFFSKKIEDDIFRERYELTLGDKGRPGRTNNPQALEIAKILEKWDRVRIDALNSEGAWIQDYAGYVTKTFHDPDRLRKAAKGGFRKGFTQEDREVWATKTLQWIDAKRTFGTAEDADKKLAEMYGGLVTGDHLEMAYGEEPIVQNVAGKVSASRELHFKDADAWLAYNKEFGRFAPTDGWLYNMRTSANHYGLMKMYGSRPKATYQELMAYAKNRTMGTAERIELDKWQGALDNRFAVVSGEAERPVANMWSGIVNGVMAVQRTAKLGLTPFAMLQDNVTISRELGRQGMSWVDRNASMLSGYFQGAEGSAKREVAELLHTGILGRLRGVSARFDISDARAGTMAKLENWFFKITGITPMTENKRADAERMMAYWMGKQRDKAWEALGAGEQRILQAFGIGDKEWALLHKTPWRELEGERYLTPDVAKSIPDEAIKAHLAERGKFTEISPDQGVRQEGKNAERAIFDHAREELALKLWSYYSERGQYAVLEVGPKERAILYQGTQTGTPLNLALRLMMQFKQFPTAMITKAWGADIYGGEKGLGRIAGLAELIVASTFFGILANGLNNMAKGQDPLAQWRNNPVNAMLSGFLRGGAGTIYGDFLLGEWSRHGFSALDSLAGPTLGQINSVAEIWSDLTHMKKGSATAALIARMVRSNLPGANMIYTKFGFDYLLYYRFMEWLNPGYLRRMEKTMKDKQGIEFLVSPQQVAG